ncbi:MAG: hypothetical protein PHZ24_04210 [Bacteroidales bacterium]|nr:hypothetical protein [Bacteroidales bacterium]
MPKSRLSYNKSGQNGSIGGVNQINNEQISYTSFGRGRNDLCLLVLVGDTCITNSTRISFVADFALTLPSLFDQREKSVFF